MNPSELFIRTTREVKASGHDDQAQCVNIHLWIRHIHRESKKQDTKETQRPQLHQLLLLSDFQNFFTSGLSSKFATNWCLNIPPRLKYVATLPCKIWMSEKCHHSEIHIASNDESQGSIDKNLKYDELLYYTFIIHSDGERIF